MHKEYKNIINGADTAILFIHGILGTPSHFKDFIPLIPESYSVHNLLLDGHGGGVKEFSNTSMSRWKNQVENAVTDILKTHKYIIIVAHSMGTLFAIQQAISKPKKIKALFLLAAPLKISVKFKAFSNSIKVFFDKIKPDDKSALAAKLAYGIEKDKRFWLYIGWIPRYLELFKEIKHTRKITNLLNVPSYIFQSKNDELVSKKSVEYLKNNSNFNLKILNDSWHYYYSKNDYNYLLKCFELLL